MLLYTKCRGNYIGVTEDERERTISSKSHVRNSKMALNPRLNSYVHVAF